MDFQHHTLDNGLELVAEVNPQACSASYAFLVRAGARDETAEISGVSHFLEHMVFKGTPRRSTADVNRELDEISTNGNAFTSEEQTVYYATVLPEDQGQIIDLLSDMMRPALRQEDFDTEKQVILEEIAKYDDQPPYGAHDKCMAAHFGSHPLSRNVLGTQHSVGNLSREQMLQYFQARYSPRNIVLAAAGNVDFPRLIDQAQEHCGAWQAFDAPRPLARAATHRGFSVIHKPLAVQQYAVQIASAPATEDDDRYAARVLTTILGDDKGSRLFWELIDTGLAEYATIGTHEFQGTGIYMTYLACTPDEAAANLQRIANIVRDAEACGVTQEELDQAKNKICAQIVLSAERPANRLFSVGNSWVQRRQYKTVREAVEAYRAVTLGDLAAVLKKYPLSECTTVAIGPLTEMAEPS
ncbi:MAG TPA: pitrilysin family protein [Pirellulaceae bacterium]|nr:pitrilysin family protein [Pirellulaceae bacterium]